MFESILNFIANNYIFIIRWASIVIFLFGLGYMLWGWVKRRPTNLMLRRIVKTRRLRHRVAPNVVNTLVTNIGFQTFLVRRNTSRWFMHFFIFVGGGGLVILHALPWIFNFTDWYWYVSMLNANTYFLHYFFLGLLGVGVAIAMARRSLRKEVPVELSSYNLAPMALIMIIVVTGFVSGFLIPLLETIPGWTTAETDCFKISHIVTVYATLAAFPFSKFFHFFIRWLAFPVNLYISYAKGEEQRKCKNCGEEYASEMRMQDLVSIVGELSEGWLLEYCPKCRRTINAQLDRAAPSIIRP